MVVYLYLKSQNLGGKAEGLNFKGSLRYIVDLKPAWTIRSYFSEKRKKKGYGEWSLRNKACREAWAGGALLSSWLTGFF